MAYGERIKARREQLDLSLRALGEATSIDFAALSRFERNLREPTISQAVVIAKALNCSVDDLVEE